MVWSSDGIGLTQTSVIPITSHQDTVGPMGRSIADVAAVLSVMAGVDPRDNYTSAAPRPIPDYTKALRKDALKGKRIGVPRKFTSAEFTNVTRVELEAFDRALDTLRSLGATVVDHANLPSAADYLTREDPHIAVDFKASGWQVG
jgi:amidase